jgi:hypothetical protein
MAKRARTSRPSAPPEKLVTAALGDTACAVISIFLFIHLFVLLVCFSANLTPSLLQQRLLRILGPYAELLNFDLDGTRYFLTHATIRDVDHRIEVLPEGVEKSWQNISLGWRGTERYHRYQRLADTLSFFQEDEGTTAVLAESIARSYLAQEGTTITQLRCRRHTLQSWETPDGVATPPSDPDSPGYFSVVYQANVLTTPSGAIRILKRAEASLEAAPDRGVDSSVEPEKVRAVGDAGDSEVRGVNSDEKP